MKKSIRKSVSLLLAGVMCFSLLSACGGGAASGSGEAVPQTQAPAVAGDAVDVSSAAEATSGLPEGPVTLTFVRAGTDELAEKAYKDLIAEYMQMHPNVTIEYQQYGFGSELDTKLNTLYASGSAPDIVRAPISTIAQRASLGQYAKLDDYIDNWEEKDNLIRSAYDVASYNGNRYGIAINIEAAFMLYRQDHFAEVGLDPEAPPKTWEELHDYAEKLTVRNGKNVVRAGAAIPTSWGHTVFIPFARQNGGVLVDEANNKPVFDETATVEALDYLATYGTDNLIIPFAVNKDQNPFELGKASIMFGSLNAYKTVKASGVEWADEVRCAPTVSRGKQSSFGGCQIMFMSEESKNKEWAWDFMQFLFTRESVWKLVTEAGSSPVRKDLSEDFVAEYSEVGSVYLESLEICQGMPKVEWSSLFEKYLNIAYEEVMYGQKPAKQALEDAMRLLKAEIGQ